MDSILRDDKCTLFVCSSCDSLWVPLDLHLGEVLNDCMRIERSTGVNPSENLLVRLCEKTFLKLWSYPNPYTNKPGKEMCDLLAVFGDHVFIFFNREGHYFDGLEDDLDTEEWKIRWNRWKKKVVDKQIKSVYGAERYLKSGQDIFLDKNRTVSFPIKIDRSKMVVHKIIIAHGAEEACKQYSEENIAGSLGVSYGTSEIDFQLPFLINLDRENPIHVFDSYNLEIILSELDTVTDLTNYLEEKVDVIRRYNLSYCGEEDLLAHYFFNYDETQKRYRIDIDQTDISHLAIAESTWSALRESEKYQARKSANEVSYFWDGLIQYTCQSALDDTLVGHSIWLGKSAVQEMAKESRLSRRMLSKHMLDSVERFREVGSNSFRRFMPLPDAKIGYVFLQIKRDNLLGHEVDNHKDYFGSRGISFSSLPPEFTHSRIHRIKLLEISCGVMRNRFDHLEKVVGIAWDTLEFPPNSDDSADFILMDCIEWPDDLRAEYEAANRKLGFSAYGEVSMWRAYEFPEVLPATRRRKTGRNEPCPCGSGKKFKKCCLPRNRHTYLAPKSNSP